MTCREVADYLMQFLDGALPQVERGVFDQHLTVCPECRDYLRSYELTIELERSALRDDAGEPAPPPPELIAAILAARRARPG